MRKLICLGLSSVAATLMAVAPAWGHARIVLDGDDTASPVDVVAARLGHGSGDLRMKLVAYEEWDDQALSGQGRFVAFEFDLDRDSRPDRCVVATWHGDVMSDPSEGFFRPYVYSSCRHDGTDEEVAHDTRVARPDRHSLVLTVRRSLLVPPGAAAGYRWRAVTAYIDDEGGECDSESTPEPYGPCPDFTRWASHGS